jgi:hypothetical protein
MSKFFDNIKTTISAKKSQYKFSKSLDRLSRLKFDNAHDSFEAVLREITDTVHNSGLYDEKSGVPLEVHNQACIEALEGYWESENFNPESFKGSVAAHLNFLMVLYICKRNILVDAGKFTKTLDRAVSEAGLEDFQIWSREKIGFQSALIQYRDRHFPRLVVEMRFDTFRRKLNQLDELKKLNKDTLGILFYAKGLRQSYLYSSGANPEASITRYIERNNPELLSEVYLAPFFNVSSSLEYDTNAVNQSYLFCENQIILVPESNTGRKCDVIKRKEIKRIICGYAYNAIVTDGIAKNEVHMIYIRILLQNGGRKVGYRTIGTNKENAMSALEDTHETIELLSDFYPFEWSDEVIDKSKHYQTTTTTTTTYYAWTD